MKDDEQQATDSEETDSQSGPSVTLSLDTNISYTITEPTGDDGDDL